MLSRIKFLGATALIVALILACQNPGGDSLVSGKTYKTQNASLAFTAGQVQFRFGTDAKVAQSIDNGANFLPSVAYTVDEAARTVTIGGLFNVTYTVSADGNTLTPDSSPTGALYGPFIKA